MGLIDKLKNSIFNINNNNTDNFVPHKPVFIKDFSKENSGLIELKALSDKLKDSSKKDCINRDIIYLKKGLAGESQVAFELKHSFLPITCFHNLRLEYKDYVAQLDFLVITDKFIAVLETKKLSGNIEINSDGEFIRVFKNSRSGMYSPVSQNNRHINILKYIISQELSTVSLPPIYSLVVLANDTAVVDMNKAPSSVKELIIKRDSVNDKLSSLYEKNKISSSVHDTFQLSKLITDLDTPINFDYESKYSLNESDFKDSCDFKEKNVSSSSNSAGTSIDSESLFEELRLYRNSKAKEKGYDYKKYHYIFPNSVIEQLLETQPRSIDELYKIKGLGNTRIAIHGSEIIKILNQHSTSTSNSAESEIACSTASDDSTPSSPPVDLKDALKKYRLNTSRSLSIKPYVIFTNKELETLIIHRPTSIEELKDVKGFSNVKCEKYGDSIVEIIKKYK